MSHDTSRRNMLRSLFGGLGLPRSGQRPGSREARTPRRRATTPARACRRKAKHVINLVLVRRAVAGRSVRSQARPGKVRGPAARLRGPAHRAPDRRPLAHALSSSGRAAKAGSRSATCFRTWRRSSTTSASSGRCTPSIPRTPPRASSVAHRHRAAQPAVDRIVGFLRTRLRERQPARPLSPCPTAAAGRATRTGFLPAQHQGTPFNSSELDPVNMIPDLQNKWTDQVGQRRQLDALQALNREYSRCLRRRRVSGRPHPVDGVGLSHAIRRARCL